MRVLNTLLIFFLLGSGFILYSLEREARSTQSEIGRIKRKISEEKKMIGQLEIEWSSLTSPQRLDKLSAEHLRLRQPSPLQTVSFATLLSKLPEVSPDALPSGYMHRDPIADMLQHMP